MIGAVGLAWCVCSLSAVMAVTTSLITWAPPGPGPLAASLPAVFGAGSLIACGVAIGLGRQPSTGRLRQSKSLWFALAVIVAAEMVLLVLVG